MTKLVIYEDIIVQDNKSTVGKITEVPDDLRCVVDKHFQIFSNFFYDMTVYKGVERGIDNCVSFHDLLHYIFEEHVSLI